MSAGKWDFTLEQGADFGVTITWQDANGSAINVTGYTARMKIKESKTSTATLISLTTENGRISLGGSAGTVTLSISAADTAALDFDTGVYDLELVGGGGTVTRLVEGVVYFSKEVTD